MEMAWSEIFVIALGAVTAGVVLGSVISRKRPPVIRFGHAFPHPDDGTADPVEEARKVLSGASRLGPRDPQDSSVVWTAEAVLGIDRARRPVYAYVGCLHPKLGRIGFIVSQSWFLRDPHGVSRCDSGGLAGCVEGFGYLKPDEARAALLELSHSASHPWVRYLMKEVRDAFGELREYLRGRPPRPSCYKDARQKCIDAVQAADKDLDRRLWTWEARSFAEIGLEDVEAVALAHEAWKELLNGLGDELPDITFLPGEPTPNGVHHFKEEQVVAAFEGGLP
jgi:hypothetical protein